MSVQGRDWALDQQKLDVAVLRRTVDVVPERVVHMVSAAGGVRDLRSLSDGDLRTGVAVACGVAELVLQAELRDGLPWDLDLVLDLGTLARSIGATRAEADRALALLLSTQVLQYSPGISGAVRIPQGCWAPAPTLRVIPWDLIRLELVEREMPRMPATALLRELAVSSTDSDGWVTLTLEEAATRTFFRRSALARAALNLERIGCLERSHHAGQRGVYRIRPLARVSHPAPRTLPVEHMRVADAVALADVTEHTVSAADEVVPITRTATIEIAGVAFPIPPGVTLTPEIDEHGRLWYRLGQGTTRIGPLT